MPIDKLSSVIVGIDSDDIEGILENRKAKVETAVTLTLHRDKYGNDIITLGRIFHDIGGGQRLSDAPKIKAAIPISKSI